MARIFKRKEGVVNFEASTQQRLQLSRNYHVQNYLVKLEVTHTNATAAFRDENLFSLINGIQLVGNGNENIKQIPGNKLFIDNIFSAGKSAKNSIVKTDGAGKVSYAYAFINLSMPGSSRPHDTILNTAVFQSLDLNIDWGSSSSLGTGITITSAKLTVYSNQLIGYAREAGETIKYYEETALSEEVTATTSEMTINLPVNKMYKAITVVATVDGIRSDAVVKGLKIKSGTTVIIEWDAEALAAYNDMNYRVENDEDLRGILIADFCERGRLSDMLNTISNFNTLELVLNVEKQSGTNFVTVYSDVVKQTSITEK